MDPGCLFWLWTGGPHCERLSPKKCEPFKLPGAGTVDEFEGGFVPAEYKKQRGVRRPPATVDDPRRIIETERMREDKCEGDSILDREHVRTILQRRSRTTDNANDTGAIHNRQTMMTYECVGISHWTNDPYGAYVDACVGGTNMDTLLDTGATTNLIRSDKARKIVDGPEIKLYRGHLETADGKKVAVDGCITTNLKLGVIDDEIEALVVPELKAEMVLGLRSLRGYKCSLEFSRDNLWTGPTEGSVVPVFYKAPQLVPRVPPDPGGKNKLEANRWDRPILTNNMSSDVLDEIPEGWPVNYESYSVNMLHDNEAEDDDMYGCPKPVSLEEALRRTRGGGRSDMVAVVSVSEGATTSKRPTLYRSVSFFDDREMYDKDELLWANNREGFSHDPGPKDVPVRLLPVRNQAEEQQVNPPGINVRNRAMPEHFADQPQRMMDVARREDAIETYDATELKARREEEPANLPSEAEGRPPGEPMAAEPVIEIGTADDGGRPTRVRKPPVRFGIDEFVS